MPVFCFSSYHTLLQWCREGGPVGTVYLGPGPVVGAQGQALCFLVGSKCNEN